MSPQRKPYAFAFVLVCVLIDMIGFGLILPVLPGLLTELTGRPPTETVAMAGLLAGLYSVMNFLANPIIGGLSDRFGRRPVLVLSVGMLGVDFLMMGLASQLWVLFLGRMLSGICGATFSTANAYIADVTDPQERGRAFGMVGAAFGLGFIIGPVIGGLLGQLDTRAPFYAAAAMSFVNAIYGAFVLPESLSRDNRRRFDLRRANPFGTLVHFWKLPHIGLFLVCLMLFALAHAAYPATWSFHGDIRYQWTSREIGLSLGFLGVVSAIFQAGLVGPSIRIFGKEGAAILGLAANVVAMVGFALSEMPWMLYAFMVVSSAGGLAGPAINLIMSTRTPANAQGELQGAASSVQSLAAIISPLMMTQILAYFVSPQAPVYFAGAAFLAAAFLAGLSIIPLMLGLRRSVPVSDSAAP